MLKKVGMLSVTTGLFLLLSSTAEAAVDKVICVPWQGDIYKSHTAVDGQSIRLKAVVKTTDGGQIWYKWNFGDGTESAVVSLSGKTKYNVEIDHVYNGAEDTPFTARLLVSDVDDTFADHVADNYLVKIAEDKLDPKVNIAIDNGLWYLYKSGGGTTSTLRSLDNSPIMVWSYSSFYASPTASAVHAFEINGHKETGNPDEDPYVEAVEHGLNFLFNGYFSNSSMLMTQAQSIGPQHGDNPDTNGNGIGIEVKDRGYRPVYQGGMVMDAIIASGTPDADSGRDYDGDGTNETYREVIQEMIDMYAWGQCDEVRDGLIQGGWRYNWNDWPDNSAAQWAAIGMIPAQEEPWNCTVPEWVKDYNDNWLDYSHQDTIDGQNIWGGFGYIGPGWSYALTPSGMVQLDFVEAETSDPRWVRSERWLADNWTTGYNWLGQNHLYAYYAFAKAMRLANPEPVVPFSSNNFDWYRGSATQQGLADRVADPLINHHYWDFYGPNLGTAWAVIILKPVLFAEAPIACFDADPNPNYPDAEINFDPSCSDHSEHGKDIDNITTFEWDWDNDGIFDTLTNSPSIVTSSFPCETIPCTYPVTLRVTDDNDPVRTATYVKNIEITYPPHPPVATVLSPYMVSLCEDDTLKLDGSDSYDPDVGEHEGGCTTCSDDTVTAWNWDLTGAPFDYTDESGEIVDLGTNFTSYFPVADFYNIGLQVADNTSQAYPSSGEGDLTDEGFGTVDVYDGCMCEVSGTALCLAVSLQWEDVGADTYYIYRSLTGPNLGFQDIGRTENTSKVAGSFVMGKPHWYRIMAETADGQRCLSRAVEVNGAPELCNPTADPGGPYSYCKGETVTLDGSGSTALAGTIVAWDWDLDNDGEYDDAFGEHVEHTWNENGEYTIGLRVTSSDSLTLTKEGTATVQIGYADRCNEPPVAKCKDIQASLDANGNVTISPTDIDNGSYDPDEGDHVTLSISKSNFSCADVDVQNLVTLNVTDDSGESDSCVANVTVVDNTAPDVQTKDLTVQLDSNGNASIAAADVDNGSSDTCGIASMTVAPSEFTCADLGDNTVTLEVTDVNGNTGTATAVVTVEDTLAPSIEVNAPATITPPDAPISFTAAATDNCSAAIEITDYSCYGFTGSGKQHSKMQSCVVSVSGDTITITDSGGVGDNIIWTIVATDQSGNETTAEGRVTVENPGRSKRGKK
ncbi:MAG: PKD domain-containing protein [Candidatus Electrothrix aestuarii]|uniref:PKD domain-containing protein n=1 Tax=Candidatus Electrothrix aestuarii TaxID=3062594 RepID=A0AAU8M2A3_9BACT|nr:PKD domain-containing protein [Candidatus Electrothrix aestuarii]